ncbi:MAG TPA: LacI family DNA-binding transcriptional regulator [Nocardioides sp.]|uniref:LacI family DNA-binding transcriptional regulator n=1 Tax=Nocardioides sp. TaxID=35761 RepID=UPI002ED85347
MATKVNGSSGKDLDGGAVTILDLARELRLSKTTVADALAGSGRVSTETRDRVRELAEKWGYVSNRAARSLRTRSTGALGLYVPPTVRTAPFYMEFALGGAERAASAGFDLTLFAQRPARRRDFGVDGAVVIDMSAADELPRQLVAAGVPVVAAGRILGHEGEHAVIETPDREMAHQMFELMRSRGARRIAFVTPLHDFAVAWAVDVSEAYVAWCGQADQEVLMRSISVAATDTELAAAIDEVVRIPGVDALVLAAEGWAARAKPMLTAHGVDVGGSFQLGSLAGDPLTDGADAAISRVDLGARAFGVDAFDLLLDILSGAADRAAVRVHPARLVPASVHPGAARRDD